MYDLTEKQKKEIARNILLCNERTKLLSDGLTKRMIEHEMDCLLKLLSGSDSFLSDLLNLLIKTENLCEEPKKTGPLGNEYPTKL